MVVITAQSHQIARQYMIRLFEEDFNDPVALGRCVALAGLSPEAFHSRFQHAGSNVMGT
jgi:AraC-like DNA-binding protein